MNRFRTAWISDLQLGTKGCNSEAVLRLLRFLRRGLGLGYWSLSAYAKKSVKKAVSFIGKFEEAIARYARDYKVGGVVCGHIHSAAIRKIDDFDYYNCGDWVESCSALV